MNLRWMAALGRLLWYPIWGALALYLALTLWLGFTGLTYPYQLDYGEGIVLWFARELAHGHSIYKTVAGYPYASSNYPPLAMLLSAGLMPIFGDGYVSGRLLNFAAAIIITALIYRIVSTATRSWRAGALGALFFIGSPYVYHWVPLFRVDLMGLGFAFAGVYFIWEWERRENSDYRQSTRYWLIAAGFFLLALYTKQTLIAAPAAAFLALFFRDPCTATYAVRCKCKRGAILFALALGAIGGAIYLAIDIATRGGFTSGLIDSNATVFLPDQLLALVRDFAFTFAPLLGLAIWEWVHRVRAGQFAVLETYALTSAATLVFAGRVGAWENYFFEVIVGVCVFASFRLKALSEKPNRQFLVTSLLLLQLVLYVRDHDPRIAANLIAQGLPANQRLAALLARTDGTLISEDMGALVTSGKEVAYYTFQYALLARSGKWDQSWELSGLRDGMFPLVILEHGTREDVDHYRRFTREFVSALDSSYAITQTIGKYEVYSPSPIAHLQSARFGDVFSAIGWSASSETLKPGAWQLEIVWQAQRATARRYTTFVHLENVNGEKTSQDDHEPRRGAYPTTRWASSEMVREVYTLNVPENLAPGKYFLRVGWYDSETGERLQVEGSTDGSIALETFAEPR